MRRREEWKSKMARQLAEQKGLRMPAPGTISAPVPVAEEKKRRERPVDEVDEIFGGGGKRTSKKSKVDAPAVAPVRRVDGMDDVFAALKASAE